jgi:hypothetical protein
VRDVEQEEVRRTFVNSTRSRTRSMSFPPTWPPPGGQDRELVGWTDPKAPQRAYLVVERAGEVVSLELRLTTGPRRARSTLCDWCHTSEAEDGARLVVAPLSGARGRAGDTVGVYVCADFACSARARRPLKPHEKSVSGREDTRVADLAERVDAFVDRVLAG